MPPANRSGPRAAISSYVAHRCSTCCRARPARRSAASGLVRSQDTVAEFPAGVVGQRDARPRASRAGTGCVRPRAAPDRSGPAASSRWPRRGTAGPSRCAADPVLLDALRDAVAVGEHQRGPVVGLRLAERAQRLLRVGAHGHPGHVDVAVGDGLQGEVLLRARSCRPRRTWPPRRSASPSTPARRCWSTPRCPDQHVDVAAAGQHVIEPAGADVVGPAVAADDPHTAADQVIHHAASGRPRPGPPGPAPPAGA